MLKGIQTPTYQITPPESYNAAHEAIELGRAYGVPLFEWQENVLTGWMGETDNGDWASTVCALCVARQNGKGEVLLVRELYGLFVLDEQILHSAHHGKTADDAFMRLWSVISRNPELHNQVRRFSEAPSRGYIELRSGARIDFTSRSKDTGRGLSIDLLIVDEAQNTSSVQFQALQFILAAKPNAQLVLTGTVPGPEVHGDMFTNYRQAALKKSSSRMAWLEWAADENDNLDDLQVWQKTNPSLGFTITEQTIIDERSGQTDEGFSRERLSMWTSGRSNEIFPEGVWNDQADTASQALSDLALAIDVTPDRANAVVALAGSRDDGTYHVEKYHGRAGTSWVVEYVSNLVQKNDIRAVVIDAKSQAASLIDAFKKEGIRVTITGEREMATACGNFYDGVFDGWIYHIAQPEVDFAIRHVRKRPLLGGEAFGWNRKNINSDITPVVAMTLALHGSMHSKVKKPGGAKKGSGQRMLILQ